MQIADGVGKRIKQERDRIGMSQAELGAAGQVGRRTQTAYEAETSSPDIRYMAAIARVGVDLLYVLTGSPSPSLLQIDESELIGQYRGASADVRLSVLGTLGLVGADHDFVMPQLRSTAMLQADESELLSRYRAALPQVRVAALGGLGIEAEFDGLQITITGGEQGHGARRSRKP